MHLKLNMMEVKNIKVILSEEAENFVRLQPVKAQQKITYNIRKLESGVMDNNLFKKLDNSEIWELRTLFSGIYATGCSLFGIQKQKHLLLPHTES